MSTLVCDGWGPQTGTSAEHHQTCLAHLSRDLNYLAEKYDGAKWAHNCREPLFDAIELGKGGQCENYAGERSETVQRLQRILEGPPDGKDKELRTFYKRMCKERRNLFTFLYLPKTTGRNVRSAM